MNPLLPPELELFYQSHWGERWPALRDALLCRPTKKKE